MLGQEPLVLKAALTTEPILGFSPMANRLDASYKLMAERGPNNKIITANKGAETSPNVSEVLK